MTTLKNIIEKNNNIEFLNLMQSQEIIDEMEETLLFDKVNVYQLSNFHNLIPGYGKISIVDEYNLKYSSTEAAYQASKLATLEERLDFVHKGKTFMEMSPSESKFAGNKKNLTITTNNWDIKKYFVMYFLLLQKFNYKYYKSILNSTENKKLVEFTTWHDKIWGVDTTLTGNNALGKLLQKVREEYNEK